MVDDRELDPSNITKWQQMIGYVLQEIYLLDDTIRRNIAFGSEDAEINDDRISEVLKIAQLEELIENKEDGLNLLLGERWACLSVGQK